MKLNEWNPDMRAYIVTRYDRGSLITETVTSWQYVGGLIATGRIVDYITVTI